MLKRTLCLILSMIMIISSGVAVSAAESEDEAETAVTAEEETTVAAIEDESGDTNSDGDGNTSQDKTVDPTMSRLAFLVKKFPAGKYWNHMGSDTNTPDLVTNKPCASHRGCSWAEGACSCNSFDRAIQCMGYAHKIAYDITGVSPRAGFTKSTRLNVDNLRVGDIIRFRNDGHSICVTGIDGTKISFTDCNWDYKCGIRWGVMDISYIRNRGFTYVLHLKDNERTNTDLYFFDHIEDYEDKTPQEPEQEEPEEKPEGSSETWVMSDSKLNVRDTASVDGKKTGSIPAGSTFYVTEKLHTEDYLWGYVTCGSVKGWAALNYSSYKSGYYQKPLITDAKQSYDTYSLSFSWDEVSGAEYYLFRLYNSDKKVIRQLDVYYPTTVTVDVEENGEYYVRVFAKNKHTASWTIGGNAVNFTVEKPEDIKITGISLSKTAVTVAKSGKLTLEATVEPENHNEALQWSSSDDEVLTVENGTVTLLACGKATVYCKNGDGSVSAECIVVIKPDKVKNIKQLAGETTTTAITFTWDAVDGADGYQVYRYDADSKKYVHLANVLDAKYTDSTAEAGKTYNYAVRAYAKTKSGTVKGSSTKAELATRPDTVTGLRQSGSATGAIRLTWDKTENATSYLVYKYDEAAGKYKKLGGTADNTCVIKTQPAEKAYYKVYTVTKINGVNLYSSASDKAYTLAGPAKPVVTGKSSESGTVTLSWETIDSVHYCYVFRQGASGWERIAKLEGDATSYTDTELEKGVKYTYRVRAVSKSGTVVGYGSYSAKITVKSK